MDDRQTRVNLAAAKWQACAAMVGYCQGRLSAKGKIPGCGAVTKDDMERSQKQAKAAYEEFITELIGLNDGQH